MQQSVRREMIASLVVMLSVNDVGPAEELRDGPGRHIVHVRLQAKIAVIGQQHHVALQPDWLVCKQRTVNDRHLVLCTTTEIKETGVRLGRRSL